MSHLRASLGIALGIVATTLSALQDPEAPRPLEAADARLDARSLDEGQRFFHERVLPILERSCFECHGPRLRRVKSGLRLSSREDLLAGGYGGPALVPGDPDASELVLAVRWTDPEFRMPPEEPLPAGQVALLERWVEMGAPWADFERGEEPAPEDGTDPLDPEVGRRWWAFRPVQRPPVPQVEQAELVSDPIDAFVLARLEQAGLEPAPPAEPRELVRRIHFDLLGLPPTLEEIEAFERDPSPQAWGRLVDELLERPEYGERWARRWLDIVRFAQTNGYERDKEKPYAWRYRDYVVTAFNADKPYDRFLLEQIAGDELDQVSADSLTATGLYRIGAWDNEPDDKNQAVFDELDDSLRTIGEGMLGVTIGCARCHDHKFDPFPQQDYYRMLAFLRGIQPYADPVFAADSATLRLLDASPTARARWEVERAAYIAETARRRDEIVARGRELLQQRLLAQLDEEQRLAWASQATASTDEQVAIVEALRPELEPAPGICVGELPMEEQRQWYQLKLEVERAAESFEGTQEWALVVTEVPPAEVPPTHLLVRGEARSPGPRVEARFPAALCTDDAATLPDLSPPDATATSSRRRRALAEWITAPTNPLTARVLVNRVWQAHFGRGLVTTPNDFGAQGSPPSHPELLDWLAATFVEEGWSLKRLHRRIAGSYVYRMSSRVGNARADELDPEGELLWRQRLRRVDAEAIRDSMLRVSGLLEQRLGGRSFFPAVARSALAGGSRPGEGWGYSDPGERDRRSLYAYVKRALPVPLLETFDAPGSAALPMGRRPTTTIASQALMLLNGELAGRASEALARRVRAEVGEDLPGQVERAFERALARRPTEQERAIALGFLERQLRAFEALPASPLCFEPLVPERLDKAYVAQLPGVEILSGPRRQWRYLRGRWGDVYNGTLAQDPDRGAAALYEPLLFGDAEVTGRVRLRAGCQRAALLLRARPDGDVFAGLELRLDPEAGALELRHHADEVELLARVDAPVRTEVWHDVRILLEGPRLRVWLDGETAPLLDARVPENDLPGSLGARTAGESLEIGGLSLTAQGEVQRLQADDGGSPQQRALESLCLALLNLNEFIYAD